MSRPTLLITGGTGFLGRRLAAALKGRYEVVLAGRNNAQNIAAQEATGCAVLPLDVARAESVRDLFAEARPEFVIHAAATKYVELAERHPLECIDVNVLGSQNVARAAVERGVRCVVGVSTDKAAPPVANTYGLSKALLERLFCSMNGKSATRFLCVRQGNIAWSTGSVFPIWRAMQEEGGVIHSTGPEMTRYFSTAREAVQLVAAALEHAERLQGRVLLRRMKSARIADILDVWVARRGGRWLPAAPRPGDRPHEFLIGEPELPHTSELALDGRDHYVIDFAERAPAPVPGVPTSEHAPRMSEREVAEMIRDPD
jgi:FlaA1/EpsC-like NDP-sugar epimerase